MTIATQGTQVEYTATGTQAIFDFGFKVYQSSDLKVYVNDTLQVGGYIVNGVGDNFGNVMFTSAPAAGSTIKIVRQTPKTQELVLREFQKFPAQSVERNFDRIVSMVQELATDDADIRAELAEFIEFIESMQALPSPLYIGDVPPPFAFSGLRWYNPSVPATYVYYVDVNSGQWVEEAAQAVDGALRLDLAATNSAVSVGGISASDLAKKYSEAVSVTDFGAVNDITVDSTAAFEAAFAALALIGGTLHIPAGIYKVTRTLYVPTGVSIVGDGYSSTGRVVGGIFIYGASSIFCEHTGPAMMSLKGSNGCVLHNFAMIGSQTAKPQTGLCLGRRTFESAGNHDISDITITGWFTKAALYMIASEDNIFRKVTTWNFGGDALYGLFTSTQDVLAVDSLFQSTNLDNTFSGLNLIVTSPSGSAACINMITAIEMGSWNFYGCYLTSYAGAYVRISNGLIDGNAGFGPFTFSGVNGEPLAGGNPTVGFDITSSVPCNLAGLSITGSRFQLYAGADKFDIRQDSNTTLLNPNIVIQPPEAFPYATSQVFRDKIKGGIVSVGREYQWTDIPLQNGWVNEFGVPYSPAGYQVLPTGEVRFRGSISAGTGAIFTLPVGLRPANSQFFTCYTGGGVGRLLVNNAGVVSLNAGTNASVELSTVRFTP